MKNVSEVFNLLTPQPVPETEPVVPIDDKKYKPTDPDEIVALDKTKSIAERKEAYVKFRNKLLNPRSSFHPDLFDPYEDDSEDYIVRKRSRVEPPRILPSMGMLPKEIMDGQMIGMYESKQDLYLLVAWLSRRVTELEDILISNNIKKK